MWVTCVQEMAHMDVSWEERLLAAKAEWSASHADSATAAQLKVHLLNSFFFLLRVPNT